MSALAVPRVDDGAALLTALARAIVALYRTESSTMRLPYPADVQRCFDRVVWDCLVNGQTPPGSVAELVVWCRDRPLGKWPVAFGDGLVSPSAVLVEHVSNTPTMACAELASHGPAGTLEQEARSAFDDCVANCPQALRPVCRDLLLQYIVVDSSAFFAMNRNPQIAQAWDYVAKLYKPAPRGFVVNGKISTCIECGMLAMPDVEPPLWCERESCRRSLEYKLYEAATVKVLDYPLRAFISKAGRTEFAVRQNLANRGFAVSPIESALGDHRVKGPNGVWTMRVQSRTEPALHAAQIATAPGEAQRLLIVMAAEEIRARPHYAKAFRKALPVGFDVTLVSDRQLIRSLGLDARASEGNRDA